MNYSKLELENQHDGPMAQRPRGLGPWDQNGISTINLGRPEVGLAHACPTKTSRQDRCLDVPT